MDRPYMICHMVTSLNGKITGDFLRKSQCKSLIDEYYRIHQEFNADGFLCGRVTMESSFSQQIISPAVSNKEKKISSFARADYVGEKGSFYAVALDPQGKLWWNDRCIVDEDEGYNGATIIEIITEDVSDSFLAHLREKKVSYLFCGKTELNIVIAMQKLKALFGINSLLLEGGGITNKGFLQEGFVDEISVVIVPEVESLKQARSLFEFESDFFSNISTYSYSLKNVKELKDSGVWIQYQK